MGWNVSCRLGNLSKFKKLSLYVFTLLFLALPFASSLLMADEPADAPKDEQPKPTYVLNFRYPETIFHSYRFTEETEVNREHSDGSKRDYNREYAYYFTHLQKNAPSDGFQTIYVAVDSLKYKFSEGGAVLEYDSQGETHGAITFEDLEVISVQLGKFWEMTYTPYGEVAKISGDDLEFILDYVRTEGAGAIDTMTTFTWLEGLSKQRLQHLSDVKKINFPLGRITADSVWKSPFFIQIEGVHYYDTVDVHIEQVRAGYFSISAVANNLRPVDQGYRFYGISNSLATIDSCNTVGVFKLLLGPRGILEEASAELSSTQYSRVKKEAFKQTIKTRYKWVLLGMWEY